MIKNILKEPVFWAFVSIIMLICSSINQGNRISFLETSLLKTGEVDIIVLNLIQKNVDMLTGLSLRIADLEGGAILQPGCVVTSSFPLWQQEIYTNQPHWSECWKAQQ